jgi:uncharacterized protein YkwD
MVSIRFGIALEIVLILYGSSARAAVPAPRWTSLAIQYWFKQHHVPPVIQDPVLGRVARKNSDALAEVNTTLPEVASAYMRFLLVRHHVRDAVVQAKAFRYHRLEELKQGIWSFLEQRAAGGFTHFGIGFSKHLDQARARVLTLILVRRRVQIQRIHAALGSPLQICAQIRSGVAPQVLVTSPRGQTLQKTPLIPRSQRRFCVEMPALIFRGRYQVEVMVEGPYGPEVAALFPLFVGRSPPKKPVQKLYPPSIARLRHQVEARLTRLLNQGRRAAGVRPLRTSRALIAVARAHSSDMLKRGFFGHRSPVNGDLDHRLEAAGLEYSHASENLALSTGPKKAHDSLMSSPSHRKNLLDARLSHVGIGVALDPAQGVYYITQCFLSL